MAHKLKPQPILDNAEIIDLTKSPLSEFARLRSRSIAFEDGTDQNDAPNHDDFQYDGFINGSQFSFKLDVKYKSARHDAAPSFTHLVFFPWDEDTQLWGGKMYSKALDNDESLNQKWQKMARKWQYCAVVAGGKLARIIYAPSGKPVFQISLPTDCEHEITHVTWAVDPWSLHPLLIYAHTSVIHVFDVEYRKFLGCHRGHGGNITSLGVHGLQPHLIFSTSRDCTTRVYDLRIKTEGPHDPFTKIVKDSYGRQVNNVEGDCVLGRCVTVLTGGRSGGHEGAVLGANFNLRLPLIATCGMDHALRIWYLSPSLYSRDLFLKGGVRGVHREDKPLFSCTTIHDARVLAIYWLTDDTLLSHSTGRIEYDGDNGFTEHNSGTVVVWQWLSIGRFFPKEIQTDLEPPLRGCISDYRESSSFKLIAKGKVPQETRKLVVMGRNTAFPTLLLMCLRRKIVMADARALSLHTAEGEEDDIHGWILEEGVGNETMRVCGMSRDGRYIGAAGENGGLLFWSRGVGSSSHQII